jgi:steroid delta-isomerase-like uncharacterized protein
MDREFTSTAPALASIARRWIEAWQKQQVHILDELHSQDFVDHDSAGRSLDRDGFKQGLIEFYAAFPDLHATIEDLVVDTESSKVAVRWSATGTQVGPFLGMPASLKKIRFKGIEIIKISNERIVERWGEWDSLDLLAQMDK